MTKERKHFINTLCDLLAADEPVDDYKNVRWLWLRLTTMEWLNAQRRAEAAWASYMAEIPDDLSDEELDALPLPDMPDRDEEERLWQQLDDVVQKDLWPRELYFGGI
jgi:hypothetical protein